MSKKEKIKKMNVFINKKENKNGIDANLVKILRKSRIDKLVIFEGNEEKRIFDLIYKRNPLPIKIYIFQLEGTDKGRIRFINEMIKIWELNAITFLDSDDGATEIKKWLNEENNNIYNIHELIDNDEIKNFEQSYIEDELLPKWYEIFFMNGRTKKEEEIFMKILEKSRITLPKDEIMQTEIEKFERVILFHYFLEYIEELPSYNNKNYELIKQMIFDHFIKYISKRLLTRDKDKVNNNANLKKLKGIYKIFFGNNLHKIIDVKWKQYKYIDMDKYKKTNLFISIDKKIRNN